MKRFIESVNIRLSMKVLEYSHYYPDTIFFSSSILTIISSSIFLKRSLKNMDDDVEGTKRD